MSELLNGRWAYRSLINNPDLAVPFDQLRFGSGTMELQMGDNDTLTGTLGGEGWSLTLTGSKSDGPPISFLLEGRGVIGGEDWAYDYLGYLVPNWSQGVDQTPAFVGSIIRVAPHSNGAATAGFVASWYAARMDA